MTYCYNSDIWRRATILTYDVVLQFWHMTSCYNSDIWRPATILTYGVLLHFWLFVHSQLWFAKLSKRTFLVSITSLRDWMLGREVKHSSWDERFLLYSIFLKVKVLWKTVLGRTFHQQYKLLGREMVTTFQHKLTPQNRQQRSHYSWQKTGNVACSIFWRFAEKSGSVFGATVA